MKRQINIIICIVFLIGLVNAGLYYEVDMNYSKGNLEIISVNVGYFIEEPFNPQGLSSEKYNLVLVDVEGGKNEIDFRIPNVGLKEAFDENNSAVEGEIEVVDEKEFKLYFPYNEKGEEFVVEDLEGNEFVREDVGEFSKVGVESEKIALKDESFDKSGKRSFFKLVIVIMGIGLLILIIYVIKRKKGKDEKSG